LNKIKKSREYNRGNYEMSESFFWWTKDQLELHEKVKEFVENHIEEDP